MRFMVLLVWTGLAVVRAQTHFMADALFEIKRQGLRLEPENQVVLLGDNGLPVDFSLRYDGTLTPDMTFHASLIGPGLVSPVPVTSPAPSGSIELDRALFVSEGIYEMIEVRLERNGELVEYATPPSATIEVLEDFLVTEVEIRELSEDDLIEQGYIFNREDYHSFRFELTLLMGSREERVTVDLLHPRSSTSGLNTKILTNPFRAHSITVIPLRDKRGKPPKLQPAGENPLDADPEYAPSLLVIPGDLHFLKSHFSVTAIVANLAPQGFDVSVSKLKARLQLPQPAQASPPLVCPSDWVQDMCSAGPDGELGTGDDTHSAGPQQRASASYVLIGERAGEHELTVKLTGEIEMPEEVRPFESVATGRVMVRDASFHVTFEHPDAVSKGQDYPLIIRVMNDGQTALEGVDVSLAAAELLGCELASGSGSVALPSIPPGESRTAEFLMHALVSGKVMSTYARVEGASGWYLKLRVGVGEAGELISPIVFHFPDDFRQWFPAGLSPALELYAKRAMDFALTPQHTLPSPLVPVNAHAVRELNDQMARCRQSLDLGWSEPEALVRLFSIWTRSVQGYLPLDLVRRRIQGDLSLESHFADALKGILPSWNTQPQDLVTLLGSENEETSCFGLFLRTQGSRTWELTGADSQQITSDGVCEIPFSAALPLDGFSDLIWIFDAEALPIVNLELQEAGPVDLVAWFPGSQGGGFLAQVNDLSVTEELQVGFDPDSGRMITVQPGQLPQEVQGQLQPPKPFSLRSVRQVDPRTHRGADLYGREVAFSFSKALNVASLDPIEEHLWINGLPAQHAVLQKDKRTLLVAAATPLGPYRTVNYQLRNAVSRDGQTLADLQGVVETSAYFTGVSVEGTVVDRRSPDLAGAKAYLLQIDVKANNEWRIFQSCDLDENGEYRFDFVPFLPPPLSVGSRAEFDTAREALGTLKVAVQLADGRTEIREFWPQAPGQTLRADFSFMQTGTVQGYVVRDGAPAAGVPVFVHHQKNAEARALVETDQTGFYIAREIEVGQIMVQCLADGALGAAAGHLTQTNSPLQLDIHVQVPTCTIVGSASYESDGQRFPAVGAVVAWAQFGSVLHSIEIPGFNHVMQGSVFAICDQDGAFSLDPAPAGSGELIFWHPSFDQHRLVLAIAEGETRDIDYVFAQDQEILRAGIIRGQVFGSGGQVLGHALVVGDESMTYSDDGGWYELQGQPIDVAHTIYGYHASENQVASLNVFLPDNGFDPNDPASLPPVLDHGDLRFPITHQISGIYLNMAGEPIPFAPVFLPPYDFRNIEPVAQSNIYGEWTANVERSGNLTFTGMNFPHIAEVNAFSTGDFPVAGLVLQERPSGSVTVRLVDHDGNPHPGGRVTLMSEQPSLNSFLYGKALFITTHDKVADNLGMITFDHINYGRIRIQGRDALHGQTPTVDAQLQAPAMGPLVLAFPQAELVNLCGTVFTSDGLPAGGGITVQASAAGSTTQVLTNDGGDFAFTNLVSSQQPVPVTLCALGAEGFASAHLQVHASLAMRQNLVLRRYGSLQVQVQREDGNPVDAAMVDISYRHVVEQGNLLSQLDDGQSAQITPSQPVIQFHDVPAGPVTVRALAGAGLVGMRQIMFAADGAETLVTITLELSSSISGTFWDRSDGVIPLAPIDLLKSQQSVERLQTVNSDDQGEFAFLDLPMRTYTLFGRDPSTGLEAHMDVTTSPFQPHPQVELVLDPVGHIEGMVFNQGEPVASANVELRGNTESLFTATDENGVFRLTHLPLGPYELVATCPALLTQAVSSVSLVTADETVHVEMQFGPTFEAQVLVHLPDASPGTHCLVQVIRKASPDLECADSAFTDDQGVAVFPALAPGQYDVFVDHPAEYGVTRSGFRISPADVSPVLVEVQYPGFGEIFGQVFQAPDIPVDHPVNFSLLGPGQSREHDRYLQTNGLGEYHIARVPQGIAFSLSASDPDTLQLVHEPVQIAQHGQSLNVDLTLGGVTRVSGRVEYGDGTEAALAEVWIEQPHAMRIQCDRYGEFELFPLPAGNITIFAKDALSPRMGSVSVSIATDGNGLPLPVFDVIITLNGVGTLEGLVTYHDGAPVTTGSITVQNLDLGLQRTTALMADGSFSVPALPLGTYQLFAHDADLIHDSAWVEVTLDHDGQVRQQDLSFEPSFTLSGLLLQSDGIGPVQNGFVELLRARDANQWDLIYSDRTSDLGDFELRHVYPGQYRLRAGNMSLLQTVDSMFTMPGHDLWMEVALGDSVVLVGTVADPDGIPFSSGQVTLNQNGSSTHVALNAAGQFQVSGLGAVQTRMTASVMHGWIQHSQVMNLVPGVNSILMETEPVISVSAQPWIYADPAVFAPHVQFEVFGIQATVNTAPDGRVDKWGVPASTPFSLRISAQGASRVWHYDGFAQDVDLGLLVLDTTPPEILFSHHGQTIDGLPYSPAFQFLEDQAQSSVDPDSVRIHVNGIDVTSLFQIDEFGATATWDAFPECFVLGPNDITVEARNTSNVQTVAAFTLDVDPLGVTVRVNLLHEGEPIDGAVQQDGSSWITTDASVVSFQNVPPGWHTYKAKTPGDANPQNMMAGARLRVEVGGSLTQNVIMDLGPCGTYQGTVMDPDGLPAENAQLMIGTEQELSHTNGEYTFDYLPMGEHEVLGQLGDFLGFAQGPPLTLHTQTALDVDLQLRGTGTVQGLVWDHEHLSTVEGAEITLESDAPPFQRNAVSAADGSFTLHQVVTGPFSLAATHEPTGRAGSAAGQLDSHGQLVNLDVSLSAAGNVTGVAMTHDGQPAANARVTLQGPANRSTTTDDAGVFTFELLPHGDGYALSMEHQASLSYLDAWSFDLDQSQLDLGPLQMLRDQPPSILALTFPSPVDPLQRPQFQLSIADDRALATWQLTYSGAVDLSLQQGLSGLLANQTRAVFPSQGDYDNPGLVNVVFQVTDHWGQSTQWVTQFEIQLDDTPPEVSFNQPQGGDLLVEGVVVDIIAEAVDTDGVGVDSVTFFADTEEIGVATYSPYSVAWTPTGMTEPTDMTLRAVALDRRGNSATAEVAVTVMPASTVGGPEVTLISPSPGLPQPIFLDAGLQIRILAEAQDEDGLQEAIITVNGQVVHSADLNGGIDATVDYTYVVPEDLRAEPQLDIMITTTDLGDNNQFTFTSVVNIIGEVRTDVTIPRDCLHLDCNPDQPLLADTTLIVLGQSNIIDGEHTFANFVLANGAAVTQSTTTPLQVAGTSITAAGHVAIPYDCALDVSGCGYEDMPPELLLGSGHACHAGLAYDSDAVAECYGTPMQPETCGSHHGGGAIKIQADQLWIDGHIRANGDLDSSHYGSGGSIWLTANAIEGLGVLQTNGFEGTYASSNSRGGGGGRIAVYGAFDGQMQAFGGEGSGCGTVLCVVPDTGESDGLRSTLILNQHASASTTNLTHLPTVRTGVVDSVRFEQITGNSFQVVTLSDPDPLGNWAWAGAVLRIAGTPGGLVSEQDGQDVWSMPDADFGDLQPGDTVELLYPIDQLVIGHQAHIDILGVTPFHGVTMAGGRLDGGADTIEWSDGQLAFSGLNDTLVGDFTSQTLELSSGVVEFVGTWQAIDIIIHSQATLQAVRQPQTPIYLVAERIQVDGTVHAHANGTYDYQSPYYACHGGMGRSGYYNNKTTYGSLYEPVSEGVGTQGSGPVAGRLVLEASESVMLDGVLSASIADNGTGSAGAVLVSAPSLSGAGTIEAKGRDGYGGGRIAILVNDVTGFQGAVSTSCYGAFEGSGPGTVFWRTSQWPLGRLVVDNEGYNVTTPSTRIPGLGVRICDQTTGGDEILGADFPDSLVGLHVACDSCDPVRIQSHTATELFPEDGGGFPVFQPGDTYYGLHRLNVLEIRGKAYVTTPDAIEITDQLILDDGRLHCLSLQTPDPLLLSDGSGEWFTAPDIDRLELDGFHLTIHVPVNFPEIVLSNGATLVYEDTLTCNTLNCDASTLVARVPRMDAGLFAGNLFFTNNSTWTVSNHDGDQVFPLIAQIEETLTVDSTSVLDTSRKAPYTAFYWADDQIPYSKFSFGGISFQEDPSGEPVFGSFCEPNRFGGSNGGGLIQIHAGHVHLDGGISANGSGGYCRYTAGSIWIDTDTLSGNGTLNAGKCQGGRLAVHYAHVADRPALENWHFILAADSSSTAGTLFFLARDTGFRELIVDQQGFNCTGNQNHRQRMTGISGVPSMILGMDDEDPQPHIIRDSSWNVLPPDLNGLDVSFEIQGTPYRVAITDNTAFQLVLDEAQTSAQNVPAIIPAGAKLTFHLHLNRLVLKDGAQLYFPGFLELDELIVQGVPGRGNPVNSIWCHQLSGLGQDVTFENANFRLILDDWNWNDVNVSVRNAQFLLDQTATLQSLTLENGARLAHTPARHGGTDNQPSCLLQPYPQLTCVSFTMDGTSAVDVSECAPNYRPPNAYYNHGGLGTSASTDQTYGSLLQPETFGAGGRGGGRFRLNAQTLSGGTFLADGDDSAGGSLWISADHILGDIHLQANSENQFRGGGGRIALDYGQCDGLVTAQALGSRSAGTVVLRHRNTQNFGELIIQNNGLNHASPDTPLPDFPVTALPADFSQAYDPGSDQSTLIVPGLFLTEHFRQHQLAINGQNSPLFTILNTVSDASGSTFILDGELPLLAPGETLQPALTFDVIDVADNCNLVPGDILLLELDNEPPVISNVMVTPLLGGKLDANQVFHVTFEAQDPGGVISGSAELNGFTNGTGGAGPFDLELTAPAPVVETQYELWVRATDAVGNTAMQSSMLTVLPSDTQSPSVTVSIPSGVTSYQSGVEFQVQIDASDNRLVRAIALTLNGETQTISYTDDELQPMQVVEFTCTAPDVTEDTAFDLLGEVTDLAGNVGTHSTPIQVIFSDDEGPEIAWDIMPPDMLYEDQTLVASVLATDPSGVDRVEFNFNGQTQTLTETPYKCQITALPDVGDPTPYALQVMAYDTFDNASQISMDVLLIPDDHTIPRLTVHDPQPGIVLESHAVVPLVISTVQIDEDVESGSPHWRTQRISGNPIWEHWHPDTQYSHSATTSWQIDDIRDGQAQLISPAFVVGEGGFCSFWHQYNIYYRQDGAQLRLRLWGETDSVDLQNQITQNGYNQTINDSSNPINGQSAWTNTLSSFVQVTVDLSPWLGQKVQLIWAYYGDDTTHANRYWAVDDIRIQSPGASGEINACQILHDNVLTPVSLNQPLIWLPLNATSASISSSFIFQSQTASGAALQSQLPFQWTVDATPPQGEITQPVDLGVVDESTAFSTTINAVDRGAIAFTYPGLSWLWALTTHSGSASSSWTLDSETAIWTGDVVYGDSGHFTEIETLDLPVPDLAGQLRFLLEVAVTQDPVFGVVLEYSTDEGLHWWDAADLVTAGSYDAVYEASGDPWEDRPCWGTSALHDVHLDLSGLAGTGIRFRLGIKKGSNGNADITFSQLTLQGFEIVDQAIAQVSLDFEGQNAMLDAPPYSTMLDAPAVSHIAEFPVHGTVYDLFGNTSTCQRTILVQPASAHHETAVDLPEGDTSLDEQDLVLEAGTHRIDGVHQFNSLVLEPGAVLTHSSTTDVHDPITLELDITHGIWVKPGAAIDLSGKGYPQDQTRLDLGLASSRSHGGLAAGEGEGAYGSPLDPFDVGAGTGGGCVRITADQIRVDGDIVTHGGVYADLFGAGGSIKLQATQTIAGCGTLGANGYQPALGNFPCGGGGRIALIAPDLSGWSGTATAFGGVDAGAGTLYMEDASSRQLRVRNETAGGNATPLINLASASLDSAWFQNAHVTLDHGLESAFITAINSHLQFDESAALDLTGRLLNTDLRLQGNLTIDPSVISPTDRNRGVLELVGTFHTTDPVINHDQGNDDLYLAGTLHAQNLTLRSGGIHAINDLPNQPIVLNVTENLEIQASAEIRAQNGEGLDGNRHSHGGMGYVGYTRDDHGEIPGESPYGSFYWPSTPGGGGGVIQLFADQMIVDGNVYANADYTQDDPGSGGSILVVARTLEGLGMLDAQGDTQAGLPEVEVAGSGGRIAIHVSESDTFQGSIYCKGGNMYPAIEMTGAWGTVFRRNPEWPHGRLIIGEWCQDNFPGGRTILPGLGETTVLTDDTDQDIVLLDPAQSFPADLAGRYIVHGSDAPVKVIDNDEHSIIGDAPFGVFQQGETYIGRHVLDEMTVFWDLTSEDEISVTTLNLNCGTLDIPNFTIPKGVTLTRGSAQFTAAPRVENLALNHFNLTVDTPLHCKTVDLDAGSNLILNELVAEEIRLNRNSWITHPKRAFGDEIPLWIQASESVTVDRTSGIDLDGKGWTDPPDQFNASHGGLATQHLPTSLYDSIPWPSRPGRGEAGGGALILTTPHLHLDGTIRSRGLGFSSGGALQLNLDQLSGAGVIDVSGGLRRNLTGGGGRIGLFVNQMHRFSGFMQTSVNADNWGTILLESDDEIRQLMPFYPPLETEDPWTLALLPNLTLMPDQISVVGENTAGTILEIQSQMDISSYEGLMLAQGEHRARVMDALPIAENRWWIQLDQSFEPQPHVLATWLLELHQTQSIQSTPQTLKLEFKNAP